MSNDETETAITVPAPENMAASIFAVIERAAINPNIDMDKFERLIAMQERIEARSAKIAYVEAFADMQPELPTIDANGNITHNGKPISKYAKWEDINEAIKPTLAKHGFALDFGLVQDDRSMSITAILTHRKGHSKDATIRLPLDASGGKSGVHSVGSTLSYGQRYAARMVLNFISRAPQDRDDDGNGNGNAASTAIGEAQIAELQRKIIDTDADLPMFLKYFRVVDLADLPVSQFDAAVRALNKKAADKTIRERNGVAK
jgi:ERF superfamily